MADWSNREYYLDYDSAVALRYHGRRQSSLDLLARLDPALSVIFGGAAFATIVIDYKITAAAAAFATAATSAINLAFGFSDRARLHGKLFKRWGQLRAELANLREYDEEELRKLEVKRALIDAESPWQLEALSVMCENEEKEFRRSPTIYKVGWFQRLMANLTTLPWFQHTEIPNPSASGVSSGAV